MEQFMRWFKHISASRNDEILSELMDQFGAEGYGVWWLILERIAETMDETDRTFARFSLKVWANSAKVSAKKFKTIVEFLEKRKTFLLIFEKEYLTIDCPNLIKYRDEWTERKAKEAEKLGRNSRSNSGETPESLGSYSGIEADTEKINKLSSLAAANNHGGKRVPSHAAAEKKSNPKNSHNAKPAVPSAGRPDVCEIESSGKQPAVPSPGLRASAELETADVPSLAKKSPREIYLDVLSSRFDHAAFPNAKVFAMLTAWEEHNVEKRDVESALEFIFSRGDRPKSPVYFREIVLDFAKAREEFKNYDSITNAKKPNSNLTHSELNAIAIAELKRENEEREKRLAAIDAEREQQRQAALDAAANAEKLRAG